ncbi:MAG: T9SS type A sorting domain-containing protein [Bacteroidales bacterium]|nr:T9SS type A sorting domain-containing protein [Bacteroidales bacterium]
MKKIFTVLALCFAFVAVNAQTAKIVLDVQTQDPAGLWGDGSGYQLLFSQANTDTSEITAMYCGYDYDASWTDKIPANASGYSWNTSSVVMGQQTLDITPGQYGYVVYNPSCMHPDTVEAYVLQNWEINQEAYMEQGYTDFASIHDDLFAFMEQQMYDNYGYAIYIAGSGNVDGRGVVNFEAGKTYTFSITFDEATYDHVNLTVSGSGDVAVEETEANTFSFFPNPANNVLNVNATDFENIEIVNMLGQTVETTNATTVNVANLTNGVYFVRVNFNNGTVATQKFVKE